MYTREDNFNLLPNINAQEVYRDGVLEWYELYPLAGYVLHLPDGDYRDVDEEGNEIFEPYYTWGGAMVLPNYNFVTNPKGYEAIPYRDGMIVLGDVRPPHESM